MLTNIAAYSYAMAASAFLVLFLLLLTSWRGRMHGMALTIACLLTALWAAAIAFQAALGNPLSLLTDILEVLRNAGWSIFILMLLGYFPQTKAFSPFKLKPYVAAIVTFYLALLLATVINYWLIEIPHGAIEFITGIVGRVALAVIGMLLVEQLYRNTPIENRCWPFSWSSAFWASRSSNPLVRRSLRLLRSRCWLNRSFCLVG